MAKCAECGKTIKDSLQKQFIGVGVMAPRFCGAKCKRDYEAGKRGDSGTSASIGGGHTTSTVTVRDETREKELELEEKKLELEKQKRREERAHKLRQEGKTFQAFLVEYGEWVAIGAVALGLVIFFVAINISTDDNSERYLELEKKEDKIKVLLAEGKKLEAVDLINELVHDSEKECEECTMLKEKGSLYDTKFNYKEYWSRKRQYCKAWLETGSKPNEADFFGKDAVAKETKPQVQGGSVASQQPVSTSAVTYMDASSGELISFEGSSIVYRGKTGQQAINLQVQNASGDTYTVNFPGDGKVYTIQKIGNALSVTNPDGSKQTFIGQ